ncbi:FtsW/RodA/SpoVE family cell cycle protein [bacterium]|nr:FtsW/RodA/SpoVE family cell cycle protein [bacterium]
MNRTLREMIGSFEAGDGWLLGSVGLLLFAGVFVVYGAGSSDLSGASTAFGRHFMVVKHLLMIGLGAVLLLVLSRVDYHVWRTPWLNRAAMAAAFALVALTLALGRQDAAGNREINRWLSIGGFSIQPVELAKLAMVMYLAERLAALRALGRVTWRTLLRTLAAGPLLLLVLLAAQPNYGNMLVVAVVTALLVYVTGIADRALRWAALASPVLVAAACLIVDKIGRRVGDVASGLQGGSFGHQVDQSLISLGAGGARGLGIGQSHNKYAFLPEAHTDFIYSLLGEETGLVGSLGVIILLVVVVWRGLLIAQRAPDAFGRLLAAGLTGSLAVYGLANLAMVLGLIPVIGVPLPFVSFGGTAMLAGLAAVGMLLSIDRSSRSSLAYRRRWERGAAA